MIVSHSHKKSCCRILVWNQQYLFLKTNLLIFNKPDHLTQNVQKLLFMQTEKKNPWTHSSLTFLFKNQSGNQITLTAPDPPGPAPFIFTDMFIKHAPPLGSHTGCNPVSRWKRREKEHLRGSKLRGRIHFGPEELKKKIFQNQTINRWGREASSSVLMKRRIHIWWWWRIQTRIS